MRPEAPRRRVLFLIPTLRAGGAERVAVTLLRQLDRTRFHPSIAVVDMSGAEFAGDLPPDVPLIDLGVRRVRHALPRIARLLWSMRPDTVLSTLGHLNLALALIRPLLPASIRFVGRETSIVSRQIGQYRSPHLWTWAYRHFYGRFDAVICQSRAMRDDLVHGFGLPAGRAVTINNPIDLDRVRQLAQSGRAPADGRAEADVLRLVSVGRLSHEKGIDLLLEAVALCRDRRVHVDVVGDGPLRGELEHQARTLGVQGSVAFHGFLANPYPLVRDADALVLPSRYEGFPNVVLEALACGTPVIATPAAGGLSEIVDGVAGCAVAAEISAPALCREICRFDKGVRVDPGVVRRFDSAAITRMYEEVLG